MKKVLVANRGEIALRVLRACRELGLSTVAIHSEVDAHALHVRFADESVCVGPGPAPRSYLNIPAIISAAEITGADAIHPGYGFLSENPHFAEICERCGIRFIGPKSVTMQRMGQKVSGRAMMKEAGVPILPGTPVLQTIAEATRAAEEIGLPVLIKASAGGGGRGMKIVNRLDQLPALLETAQSEAQAAFGNGDVFLEKLVERPRHVEVQVVADGHGRAVALFERDCSMQRRHQKVIEEAPAIGIDAQRAELLLRCQRAMEVIGYEGLGTLEFLLDESGQFYFLEMNTRVQVEHPITEAIVGCDLVKEQLRIALGERLSSALQTNAPTQGHAIECRINAEDPVTFAPSPGKITALYWPGGPGIRVDTHVHQDYVVPPHYDSLLCKIIAHAPTRQEAIVKMRSALAEVVVEGIRTNVALHRRILDDPDFLAGRLSTRLVESLVSRPLA